MHYASAKIIETGVLAPANSPPEIGQAEQPIALLYGHPVTNIPADLFIPPDALRIMLEAFEGPLDLLLYLIRRQNLDVLDIPMAQLTAQYMAYVEMMQAHQLELAAEYLLMAALLIEIKSRMLLPRPRLEEEEADPRAELVRRLLAYEQMKKASHKLDDLPQLGRDFQLACVWLESAIVARFPAVGLEDLHIAWLGLIARAKASRHHKVTREQLSVRERMSTILRRLRGHEFVEFSQLFNARRGIAELVVSFLAILELARESLIHVTQQGSHSPIYVKAHDGPAG